MITCGEDARWSWVAEYPRCSLDPAYRSEPSTASLALRHFVGFQVGLLLLGGSLVGVAVYLSGRALTRVFCRRLVIAGDKGSYQPVATADDEDEVGQKSLGTATLNP